MSLQRLVVGAELSTKLWREIQDTLRANANTFSDEELKNVLMDSMAALMSQLFRDELDEDSLRLALEQFTNEVVVCYKLGEGVKHARQRDQSTVQGGGTPQCDQSPDRASNGTGDAEAVHRRDDQGRTGNPWGPKRAGRGSGQSPSTTDGPAKGEGVEAG